MNQEMSGVHVFRPYQILLWAAVPIYFVHEENIMPKAILILPRVAWMLNSQLSIPHNLGLFQLSRSPSRTGKMLQKYHSIRASAVTEQVLIP